MESAQWSIGALTLDFVAAVLLVSVLLGTLLSIAALALEEFSFRHHASDREVARMVWYALVENVGYRQLNELWRLAGLERAEELARVAASTEGRT